MMLVESNHHLGVGAEGVAPEEGNIWNKFPGSVTADS